MKREKETKIMLRCWRTSCKKEWVEFGELIERGEEFDHFDYVCPECESVIICSNIKVNLKTKMKGGIKIK